MFKVRQVQVSTLSLMLSPLQGAEPSRVPGKLTDSQQQQQDRETYLTHLYGKLPHEGQRRTLKRSAYPRFSSPASPLGRKPRPRLVESIRGQKKQTIPFLIPDVPDVQLSLTLICLLPGVTMKSCKTQTSMAPPLTLAPPLTRSHLPSHDAAHLAVTSADSLPAAMAIPLGQ